jgi:hypothetical protein
MLPITIPLRLSRVAAFTSSLLILSGLLPTTASSQTQYSTTEGEIAPAPCNGIEEFYSLNAYPYFNNDDYFFDANPFTLSKWTSTSSGVYRSTRGYSLVDVTGQKIWRDARVAASCYEINLAVAKVHYAIVTAILGMLVDRTTACNDSGPNTGYAAIEYDPYAESGNDATECPSGSGSGGGGAEGGGCRMEWLIVEISYDAGASWHTLWEGYGWVC